MTGEARMLGLGHCSTCLKARAELEAAGWRVVFRDVRDEPLSAAEWQQMLNDFGEKLVNRASLTWRAMSEAERAAPPVEMLMARPALMRRPAVIANGRHLLGWTANVRRALDLAA